MYILLREIYESGSVTALAVTSSLTVKSVVGVCVCTIPWIIYRLVSIHILTPRTVINQVASSPNVEL